MCKVSLAVAIEAKAIETQSTLLCSVPQVV